MFGLHRALIEISYLPTQLCHTQGDTCKVVNTVSYDFYWLLSIPFTKSPGIKSKTQNLELHRPPRLQQLERSRSLPVM